MKGPWNLLSRGPPNQIKRSPQPLDSYLCTVFCLMSLPPPGDPILRCDPCPRSIVQMDNVETLAAPIWQPCRGCPIMVVLCWGSYRGCPFRAVLSLMSSPGCPVLSWLFCPVLVACRGCWRAHTLYSTILSAFLDF
jgi:hypothetical protein